MDNQDKLNLLSNEDFDTMMCQTFPIIFQDRNKSMMETCMCWGFDTPKGWNNILFDLCEKLDLIQKTFNIEIIADQVKEKYGTLRFYYHIKFSGTYISVKLIDNIVQDLISLAEYKTEHICYECGEYSDHNKGYYFYCDKCDKKEGIIPPSL